MVQAEIRRAQADFAVADAERQVRPYTGCLLLTRIKCLSLFLSLCAPVPQTLEASHAYLSQLDALADRLRETPAAASAADQVCA